MNERIPAALQGKISKRLAFYRDIGIDLFYRDRQPAMNPAALRDPVTGKPTQTGSPLPKAPIKPAPMKFAPPKPAPPPVKSDFLPRAPAVSLFDAANRVAGDSLPIIQ